MKNFNLDKNKHTKAMQRKLTLIPLCLCILLCACSTPSADAERPINDDPEQFKHIKLEPVSLIDPTLTAKNAYVFDYNSDTVIYYKDSSDPIAPASTTKLLTALTASRYCSFDEAVTVGTEIGYLTEEGSRAWLFQGDKLTMEQLLVAMLLPSGNDAAYAVAVHVGAKIIGKAGLSNEQYIECFVEAMNETAKSVGAQASNFISPDGYDTDGQYTTAFDLAQIAKACLSNETLAQIMGSYTIYDTWLNGREVTYYNTNELLNPNGEYYYADAIGLKTGNSSQAGSCLVSAAVINGKTYVCVLMGSTIENIYPDTLSVFSEIEHLAAQG